MKNIITAVVLTLMATYAMAEVVIIATPTDMTTCIVLQGLLVCS